MEESRSGPLAVAITGDDWLDVICPLLRARDGSWRSASPAREHRCWATDPPSELAVLTQQRLCLVRAHDGCERFLHARELRASALARERQRGMDWVPGQPGVLTARRRASGRSRPRPAPFDRLVDVPVAAWIAVGIGALVIAVVLSLAMTPRLATTDPAPAAAASTLPSIGPDGMRHYTVRDGDTLRTIADRFGVTVRELRRVNDLGDPPTLTTGDVILIPVRLD
jgi:hypothetical protein